MKKIYIFLTLIILSVTGYGQTTLSAGDIAIFGVNTDNPDDFGFVLLVDIDAGTEIRFTDSGWKSDNTFRGNEGAVKYTAPTALPAGTEITYQGNSSDFTDDNDSYVGTNGFNLSASGDQVFAFQGPSNNPTFIFAVQTNSTAWQTDATSSNNSALPQGLTDGVNAVAVGSGSGSGDEYDNAAYDTTGTTSGSASEILSAISDNSNWLGNNSTRYNLADFDFDVGVGNPLNFTAVPATTDQINLSWSKNSDNDSVMIAWSSDGTFGTPVNGTVYKTGDPISGGGTVIYRNDGTSYSHTGLTQGTHYYYKAWSVNNSGTYSSGVEADTSTLKAEPSNHVANFTAGNSTSTSISLSWDDNDGSVAADGYLIKINKTGSFTTPVDGSPESDDTDVSDGAGEVNVNHGTQSYTWQNLDPNTTYYFIIYPYTNSGSNINYKTDGTVPTTSASTANVNLNLIISEVADPSDSTYARFVELYNLGSSTIDFSTDTWYLARQVNGGTFYSVQLSGSIPSGNTYVVAYSQSRFNNSYGFNPDQASGYINGNGDDGYFLYYGGDHTTGTLIDAYGVRDEDGTGKDWEYTNTKAVRLRSVTSPNTTWTASEWDIPSSASTGDMTPSAHNENVNWQGNTSSDWNTKGNNWSGAQGFIPDASFNVTVPQTSNQPHIDNSARSNNVSVNSNSELIIEPSASLTVYGNISVATSKNKTAGTLKVSSDNTGDASLIVKGSSTGPVTVQRYVQAGGWHLISPSTTGVTAQDLYIDSNHNAWLVEFDESGDTAGSWSYITDLSQSLTVGTGYSYWVDDQDTSYNIADFKGSLQTQDLTVTLQYTDSDHGWNLLGNPFSSALDFDKGTWDPNTVTSGFIYVWDDDYNGGDYRVSGTDLTDNIIPMGQGFFVEATSSGNFTIPAEARVHSTQDFWKKSKEEKNKPYIKIQLGGTGVANTVYIGFPDFGTDQRDYAGDARKLYSSATKPQLYAVENDLALCINTKAPLSEEHNQVTVPLYLDRVSDENYSLTFSGTENLENTGIILEDLKTGSMQDMKENPVYNFTSSQGDSKSRFLVHFLRNVTGIPDNEPIPENVKIYSYGKDVYVNSVYDGKVFIYNMLGENIAKASVTNNKLRKLHVDLNNAIVIVKVISGNSVTAKTVFLH